MPTRRPVVQLSGFSRRLVASMEAKPTTQRALARAVGITQQTVGYLCSQPKGREPRSKHATAIARFLRVDPDWLATGTGPRAAGSERASRFTPRFRHRLLFAATHQMKLADAMDNEGMAEAAAAVRLAVMLIRRDAH